MEVSATDEHEDNDHDRKCDICGKPLPRTAEDAVSVFSVENVCEQDLIRWSSAAIVIGDTVSLRIKFHMQENVPDGNVMLVSFADGTDYTFTKDDAVQIADGLFYIEIRDIPASRYDTEFTVAMYADGEIASDILHYSVASYVYAMKDHVRTGSRVREMYEDSQS